MWTKRGFCALLLVAALTIDGAFGSPAGGRRKPNRDRHNDCKLTFNIERGPDGQTRVKSIEMPRQMTTMGNGAGIGANPRPTPTPSTTNNMDGVNVCNLVFALQPTLVLGEGLKETPGTEVIAGYVPTEGPAVAGSAPPSTEPSRDEQEPKDYEASGPVYELQMSVWPADLDDLGEVVGGDDEQQQQPPTPSIPLYEQQEVVFPENEDNLPDFNDESTEDEAGDLWPVDDVPQRPGGEGPMLVLENYHVVHPNGTIEYKVSFSNGAVDYKKIYPKLVDGRVITVQEGYSSVPILGHPDEFQTEFYIADERGHNVYKVEHTRHRPELPSFLSYSEEMKDAGMRVV